ncbi:hypothetical protein KPL74_14265 [Bacillus sp. NP157]|nr:hypothetical protein KPL74_14265 [Bacillus sp. NP157]
MKYLLPVAICLMAVSMQVNASESIKVSLHHPTAPGAPGTLKVEVEFTNVGDEPAYIYRPESPFGRNDDTPSSDFLQVFDSSGNARRYIGSRDHWGRPEPSHFLPVAPGESIRKEVDIAHAYDFGSGGMFTVRYATIYRGGRKATAAHATASPHETEMLSSDDLVVFAYPPRQQARQQHTTDLQCTAEQSETIDKAVAKAKSRAFAAGQIQNAMYISKGSIDDPWYEYRPNKRFDRWFGKPQAADPLPHETGWYDSLNYLAIRGVDATYGRLFDITYFDPLKKACGCPGRPPEAVAAAEDHNLYAMTFCPRFFTLPEDDPVSSRTGTVVHEMSHFYDHVSPGLSDFGYGKACAQDLALQDRATAVKNADNVEFFVMDTTPYDEVDATIDAMGSHTVLPPSCQLPGLP